MDFIHNIELSEKTLLLVSVLPFLFFGFHTTYWYDAKKLRLLDAILASISVVVAAGVLLKLAVDRGSGSSVLLGLCHLPPPILTLLILSMSRGIGRYTRAYKNQGQAPNQSDASSYSPAPRNKEIERLSWNDLIVEDSVKEELQSVIELLKNPSYAINYGIDVPKGILLNGPPGTGKTTIAKVMANQAGLSFFPLKMDEVVSKWVGESEKNLSRLFQAAQRAAPAVVFIDEIDSIGKNRSGAQQWADNLLNHLLQLIDGVVKVEGLYVIGATNRADQVDSALRRAGRLSRTIEIPLPDFESRAKLFVLHLSKLRLEPGIDLQQLASITEGASGAVIKEICNRAGLHAYKRESGSKKRDYVVRHEDLDVALKEVLEQPHS